MLSYFSISFDPLLKANATYQEIVESMKHPANGLTFVTITTHQSLPQHTFIAADAVNWLMAHMEGITSQNQAIQVQLSLVLLSRDLPVYFRFMLICKEKN